jgi:hypothetical protein
MNRSSCKTSPSSYCTSYQVHGLDKVSIVGFVSILCVALDDGSKSGIPEQVYRVPILPRFKDLCKSAGSISSFDLAKMSFDRTGTNRVLYILH